MNNSKKYFLPDGGVDNDTALQFIDDKDLTNLQNCIVGVNEYGKTNRVQNRPGTLQISNNKLPPYGTMFTFGSCVDGQRNYIIYADFCSHGDHGIYAYDTITGTTYAVIYDSQVVGGLNFSKSYRIDRNMYVVGDVLYYTDNNNEPRAINYIAGIKSNQSSYVTDVVPYFFPIKYQSSTVIVRPPIYALTATKQTDASFLNNFIALNAYQFTMQYVFKDYQYSALADYSLLVPFNTKGDTYNNILVKLPFAEFIDNEVQIINMIVKYGNTGNSFIIRTWYRSNTADAAAIFSHNLGNVQLQYDFYDNVVGIAVDAVTSVTSFSNVPLKTKTLLPAKNRLFMFNNLMGYNTPTTSSLSASQSTSNSDPVIFKSGSTYKISICFYDRFKRKCGTVNVSVPIVTSPRFYTTTTFTNLITWLLSNTNASTEIPDWAYYYQILISKNLTESFFIQGATQYTFYAIKNATTGIYTYGATKFDNTKTAALAVSLQGFTPYGIGYVYAPGDVAILYLQNGTNYTIPVIGQDGEYVLLSATDIGTIVNNYNFTLVPFVATATGDTFYWPATADQPTNNPDIITQSTTSHELNPDPPNLGGSNWSFDIKDGLAHTYQVTGEVVLTLGGATTAANMTGLIAVTKFPGLIGDVVYYTAFTEPMTAGNYTASVNVTVTVPVGYNRISLLINTTGATPSIDVTVISGNLLFSQDGAIKLLEIYTPNKENIVDQPFYGYGSVMNVTNPTASNRTYSTLTGTITGDSSKISRTINTTTYNPESMSPNDLTWQQWQRSLGWFNSIDNIGQQQKKDSFAFSDTLIDGSKTNGLCSFQPLNQQSIGTSSGQIQKAILTNKQQEDGTVVLILTDNESLTMYLGETQVVASAKNTFVSVSDGTVGTINELRGNSGTVDPSSVILYLGEVYWVDRNNGWISQYSSNGVFPISSFKMSRFFQRYLKNYAAASTGNLDNINGFHHISMMIDPFHKRLNVVLPGLIYENYAATLPSYSSVPSYATSIVNNFDAYTELPKIMCFDFINNRWKESLQGLPEWSEYVGDKMYGFKAGLMYIHDADTANYNKFYGTQYPIRIMIVPNAPPSAVKDMMDMSVEGTVTPDFTVLYSTWPFVQITDLTASDFRSEEGVQYARFFRDRLSPNATGTADQKLYSGDIIQSEVAQLMIEVQAYTELVYINALNISWNLSRGQQKIVK